jgi:hypothetical protein
VYAHNYYTGTKQNIVNCLPHPRFAAMRHDIVSQLHVEVSQIL